MKYKVGDKVRVRKDLVARRDYDGAIYGRDLFVHSMAHLRGEVVTIESVFDEKYLIEEDNGTWNWTDEMLEPVEEVFNVGDVVYKGDSNSPLTILRKAWVVCYQDIPSYDFFEEERELSKTKTLQKITREELAEKGYELVD